MRFTSQDFPVSFTTLRQDLQKKAIEAANYLLSSGFNEMVAEQVALSIIKLSGRTTSQRIHLVPHIEGWVLISGNAQVIYFIESVKSEALVKARAKAKTEKLRLYIHSLEGNISDSESFMVNSPANRSVIWQEEYLDSFIPGPADMVQERTRQAIRKARFFAQKVQGNLSINNSSVGTTNQLSLDY